MVDSRMLPLIDQYLGLAESLALQAWRTAPHALDLDECRSIAYLGLVDAADRWYPYCQRRGYDPDRVEYFKPFVVLRVHGSLIDAMRASDWATRSLRTRFKALQEAGQDRGASEAQLVERTGMTVRQIRSTLRGMAQRPVSLEAVELDPASGQDVESSVVVRQILGQVDQTIRALPEDQRVVVALHYHRGLQLQEISRAMGISESRASQLHAKAVLTIHEAMVRSVRAGQEC
jgi:RNA polymerase sigma factor FliA